MEWGAKKGNNNTAVCSLKRDELPEDDVQGIQGYHDDSWVNVPTRAWLYMKVTQTIFSISPSPLRVHVDMNDDGLPLY